MLGLDLRLNAILMWFCPGQVAVPMVVWRRWCSGALCWCFGGGAIRRSYYRCPLRPSAHAFFDPDIYYSTLAPRLSREGLSLSVPSALLFSLDCTMYVLRRVWQTNEWDSCIESLEFFSVSTYFPSQDLSMCASAKLRENARPVSKTRILAALWFRTHWSRCFMQSVTFLLFL
jgi:hypothetical protein